MIYIKFSFFLIFWLFDEFCTDSAGYDALASDELSNILLRPDDYGTISEILRESFGTSILFGLEGGYSLRDLPLAMKASILPFLNA